MKTTVHRLACVGDELQARPLQWAVNLHENLRLVPTLLGTRVLSVFTSSCVCFERAAIPSESARFCDGDAIPLSVRREDGLQLETGAL